MVYDKEDYRHDYIVEKGKKPNEDELRAFIKEEERKRDILLSKLRKSAEDFVRSLKSRWQK